MRKLIKYFKYFDYYLLVHAQNQLGMGLLDPQKNGELFVLGQELSQYDSPLLFDVGANVGKFTEKAMEVNPTCSAILFEPDDRNFKTLSDKFSDDDRIKLEDKALSDKSGILRFYSVKDDKDFGSGSIYYHYYLDKKASFDVQSTTIDEYMMLHKLDHIHYMKMDIEGAEVPLLEGAKTALSKNMISFIHLEYNATWLKSHHSFEDLWRICQANNYKVYRICKRSLIELKYYHHIHDNFIYQNFLLVAEGVSVKTPIKRDVYPSLGVT